MHMEFTLVQVEQKVVASAILLLAVDSDCTREEEVRPFEEVEEAPHSYQEEEPPSEVV
jgi:hypothetical protein